MPAIREQRLRFDPLDDHVEPHVLVTGNADLTTGALPGRKGLALQLRPEPSAKFLGVRECAPHPIARSADDDAAFDAVAVQDGTMVLAPSATEWLHVVIMEPLAGICNRLVAGHSEAGAGAGGFALRVHCPRRRLRSTLLCLLSRPSPASMRMNDDPHVDHRDSLNQPRVQCRRLHCMTGCSIGEVLGMAIGTAIGMRRDISWP